MKSTTDINTLTTISREIVGLSNLVQKVEGINSTGELSAPLVKYEVDHSSFSAVTKREGKDLWTASINNRITGISMIKVETQWNQNEKQILEDIFMYEQNKPEYIVIVKKECKLNENNYNCHSDLSDKISATVFPGSNEYSSKQTILLVSKNTSELEKSSEIVLQECKIKEEVDVEEQDFNKNLIVMSADGTNLEETDFIKKYKCPVCLYQSKWKTGLNRHLKLHKNPEEVRRFKCDTCDFKTIHKCNIKKHLLQHKDRKEIDMFKCDQCEYQTLQKVNLKLHLQGHKNVEDVDILKCDKCSYQTLRPGNLKTHQLRHKDPKKVGMFSCDKCNFKTMHKSSLKTHCIRHEDPDTVKYLRCHKCEYRTVIKSHLNRHILRHKNIEEVDTFQCNQCSYKTIQKMNLKRHLLLHKNPQEVDVFECDICDFRTIHKESLRRHLLQHKKTTKLK